MPKAPATNDVIIIGSGFGGAISTKRLAEAGIKVAVLERGQKWPTDPWRNIHSRETFRDGRGVWRKKRVRTPLAAGNATKLPVDFFGGILDVTEYDNIDVLRAALVGGGSKVFTGVAIQPKQQYFEEIFGNLVSYKEMNEIYYPRVREMLNLCPVPKDIKSKAFGHRRIWDEQARNAGYVLERPDSNFNWNIIRDELEGRIRKSATVGQSNMGNSIGAKFDLTQNYLLDTEKSGNAVVYPNHQVTDIVKNAEGTFLVKVNNLSPEGKVVDKSEHITKRLFLSAGSIGTSELLVRAKAKGLIPGLNAEIGLSWGSNGNVTASRSFNPIKGLMQVAPCTTIVRDDDGPAPLSWESWYVPGLPFDIGIQGSLGVVYDRFNRGHFEYVPQEDKVELRWGTDYGNLAKQAARRVNNILAKAKPRSKLGVWPVAPDVGSGFTAHPLGGAVIGKATDAFGRVYGVEGLYVADGALLPGTCGAENPSLAISALVERNIDTIIREHFSSTNEGEKMERSD